jgi:hypothetical protein
MFLPAFRAAARVSSLIFAVTTDECASKRSGVRVQAWQDSSAEDRKRSLSGVTSAHCDWGTCLHCKHKRGAVGQHEMPSAGERSAKWPAGGARAQGERTRSTSRDLLLCRFISLPPALA